MTTSVSYIEILQSLSRACVTSVWMLVFSSASWEEKVFSFRLQMNVFPNNHNLKLNQMKIITSLFKGKGTFPIECGDSGASTVSSSF